MTQMFYPKVHQVAQEIQFAKALASNDKLLRERALKRLRRWIATLSKRNVALDEEGCLRLWKGILSNVWMSDKPLVQEQTVDTVCSFLFLFTDTDTALMFIKTYLSSISHMWMSLDLHRLDKFMMLVRRFLRGIFDIAKTQSWNDDFIKEFSNLFSVHLSGAPPGLVLHTADIFLEELAKVGAEEITEQTIKLFLTPWMEVLSKCNDNRLIGSINDNIFLYLLKQSDLGIEHSAKFDVWKSLGFPGGNIKVIDDLVAEADNDSIDEDVDHDETSLDPRAGHVDVVLPTLQFSPKQLIKEFKKYLALSNTTTKARKAFKQLINKFSKFVQGRYPLGIHEIPLEDDDIGPEEIEDAADDLLNFELDEYKRSLTKKRPAFDLSASDFTVPKKKKTQWVEKETVVEISDDSPQGPMVETKAALWEVTASLDDTQPSMNGENQKVDTQASAGEEEFPDSISEESEDGGQVITIKQKDLKHGSLKNTKKDSKLNLARRWSFPTQSESKRVNFVLSNNTTQEPHEYIKSVKSSPSLPFDVKKKPLQGVLKHTHLASPINPFYKLSKKKQLRC